MIQIMLIPTQNDIPSHLLYLFVGQISEAKQNESL